MARGTAEFGKSSISPAKIHKTEDWCKISLSLLTLHHHYKNKNEIKNHQDTTNKNKIPYQTVSDVLPRGLNITEAELIAVTVRLLPGVFFFFSFFSLVQTCCLIKQGAKFRNLVLGTYNDVWAFIMPDTRVSHAGQDPEPVASSLRACLQRNLPYCFLSTPLFQIQEGRQALYI